MLRVEAYQRTNELDRIILGAGDTKYRGTAGINRNSHLLTLPEYQWEQPDHHNNHQRDRP